MAVETNAPFYVESEPVASIRRVRFIGEFDLAGVSIANAVLEDALDQDDHGLMLDLGDLSFLDSSGLRFLVGAVDRCHEQQRTVTIRRGPAAVQRVFEMTCLDRVLPFAD